MKLNNPFKCPVCKEVTVVETVKPNSVSFVVAKWECETCKSYIMTKHKREQYGARESITFHIVLKRGIVPKKKNENPFDKMGGND